MPKKTGIREVSGTMIHVDKTLFLQTIDFLGHQDLLDKFAAHLDQAGTTHILVEVTFANELKRFLLKTSRKEAFGRMIVASSCGGNGGGGGGGGGGTAGVRG